ncbi:2034_t:CDS:2 [Entrophospora sp. SA101]|nr:2034_t:CDS:2 [Entrophospora sp. SA101]
MKIKVELNEKEFYCPNSKYKRQHFIFLFEIVNNGIIIFVAALGTSDEEELNFACSVYCLPFHHRYSGKKSLIVCTHTGITPADIWKNMPILKDSDGKELFDLYINTPYCTLSNWNNCEIMTHAFEKHLKKNITVTDLNWLPLTICEPINENNFWRDLHILKTLLLPLCGCLNILQHDKSYLYEALHSFRCFYQVSRDTKKDAYLSEKMCARLEKDDLRKSYYCAWKQSQPVKILCEFSMYQNKQYPFNEITWNKWNGDILNYWDWCAKKTTELGYIAKRILSFLQDFYILHVEIDLIFEELSIKLIENKILKSHNYGEPGHEDLSEDLIYCGLD